MQILTSRLLKSRETSSLVDQVESLQRVNVSSFRRSGEPPDFLVSKLPKLDCLGQCAAVNIHGAGALTTLRESAVRLAEGGAGVSLTWSSHDHTAYVAASQGPEGVSRVFRAVSVEDRSERMELFKLAIDSMGLNGSLSMSIENDKLYLTANPPYSLSFPAAGIDGSNPDGFRLTGPEDFHVAVESCRHLLDIVERYSPFQIKLNANPTPIQYKLHFDALNVSSPWEVDVSGYLSKESIDVLYGRQGMTKAVPFIPAFAVYDRQDRGCYCAQVLESGKEYFEFTSFHEDWMRRIGEFVNKKLIIA